MAEPAATMPADLQPAAKLNRLPVVHGGRSRGGKIFTRRTSVELQQLLSGVNHNMCCLSPTMRPLPDQTGEIFCELQALGGGVGWGC